MRRGTSPLAAALHQWLENPADDVFVAAIPMAHCLAPGSPALAAVNATSVKALEGGGAAESTAQVATSASAPAPAAGFRQAAAARGSWVQTAVRLHETAASLCAMADAQGQQGDCPLPPQALACIQQLQQLCCAAESEERQAPTVRTAAPARDAAALLDPSAALATAAAAAERAVESGRAAQMAMLPPPEETDAEHEATSRQMTQSFSELSAKGLLPPLPPMSSVDWLPSTIGSELDSLPPATILEDSTLAAGSAAGTGESMASRASVRPAERGDLPGAAARGGLGTPDAAHMGAVEPTAEASVAVGSELAVAWKGVVDRELLASLGRVIAEAVGAQDPAGVSSALSGLLELFRCAAARACSQASQAHMWAPPIDWDTSDQQLHAGRNRLTRLVLSRAGSSDGYRNRSRLRSHSSAEPVLRRISSWG